VVDGRQCPPPPIPIVSSKGEVNVPNAAATSFGGGLDMVDVRADYDDDA
jgi:hypothetical protein